MKDHVMTQNMRLDGQDQAALRKLDGDFVISNDGEVAVVEGEMQVQIIRPDDDGGARLCLTITFPNNETLDVRIARAQLIEQLGIES